MTVSVATGTNVLGIDFGGTKVAIRLEAPDGTGVEKRLRIGPDEPAALVLDRTFSAAAELAEREGAIGAVGVSTPGIVFDDRIDLAPNVNGWSDLDLGTRLRAAFGAVPLSIENDVKTAAIAEGREGALRDVEVGLYVNLGTGIAIAPVIGGDVLRGAHGAAGEVGYAVVGAVAAWTDGAPTLEEFAGGSGLSRRISEDPRLPVDDVAGLLEITGSNGAAAEMWREAVDEIARHLVTAALAIDPSRIVVGGGMVRAGTALFAPLTARITAALPYPPEIVASGFEADASLRGAVILARSGVPAEHSGSLRART